MCMTCFYKSAEVRDIWSLHPSIQEATVRRKWTLSSNEPSLLSTPTAMHSCVWGSPFSAHISEPMESSLVSCSSIGSAVWGYDHLHHQQQQQPHRRHGDDRQKGRHSYCQCTGSRAPADSASTILPRLNGCASTKVSSSEAEDCSSAQQQLCRLVPLVAMAVAAAASGRQPEEAERKQKQRVKKCGELIEGDLVYRQAFAIRSYEVGFDRLASVETLTNLFQETALNHVGMSDFVGDGLGTTHAMMRHGLIWVVTRMHIRVQRYPVWGDVVEIDSWINGCGKNFIRRDFHVRDYATGETLCVATSTWAMMDKETRRLSKIPAEVHEEISPYYLDRHILEEDESGSKIPKLDDDTASYIHNNLVPKLHDMDMNQHVNNVKYIGWVLDSVPEALLVAHELKTMTLEYRRECSASDMVASLTSPSVESSSYHTQLSGKPDIGQPLVTTARNLEYTHLLKMQSDGSEILRGRTVWRLKQRFWSK